MKTRLLFALLVMGALALAFTATAGDLYLVTLRGTCRTLDQANRYVTRTISSGTIIRDCVASLGPGAPSTRTLRLAYDIDADKISVVDITTGAALCTFVSFDESEMAANPTDTFRVRHVYLANRPTLDGSVGSAVLIEHLVRSSDGNTVLRYSSSGNFHYIVRATLDQDGNELTRMQACTGSLAIGGKLRVSSP